MSNEDMINVIINSLKTDENVINFIRIFIINQLQYMTTDQLQQTLSALGIDTNG